MHRRDFVAAWAATFLTSRLDLGTPSGTVPQRLAAHRGPLLQNPQRLGPEVYRDRRQRAQEELARRGLDLLVATPSVNFQYLVGSNPGRSERLIAVLLPKQGDAVVVAPSFEVERVRRGSTVEDVRGWEESEDPFTLLARVAATGRRRAGRVALEPSTEYQTYVRMAAALPRWAVVDGAPLFERLRIVKRPEELALIRRAIEITQESIAAAFTQVREGMTDRDVAGIVSREMSQRGASGGGLVQFGPTSALPHGGTEGRRLEPGMPVLMDCGARVEGYTSDITRTQWFGGEPPARFKQVFNTVHAAQTAAMSLGRPGVPCQEMDRAARRVIRDAGFGDYFTHRLGHGVGMEGHEAPYLVEGSALLLEPGMVVTVEPGIYLPNEWGVRIEDDCVVTADGFEVLSRRTGTL